MTHVKQILQQFFPFLKSDLLFSFFWRQRRSLFILTSLCGICFSLFAAEKEDHYTWQLFSSPTRAHLKDVRMNSSQNGFISGDVLLEYFAGNWVIRDPVQINYSISSVSYDAFSRNDIWRYSTNYSNDVVLDHFDGKQWKAIVHPFANYIMASNIQSDGTAGWVK